MQSLPKQFSLSPRSVKTQFLSVLVVLAGLGYPIGARAVSYDSWANSVGARWEAAANWSAGAPSSSFTGLFITNANTKTVSLYSTLPAGTLTISNLTVAGPIGTTNTLAVGVSGSLTEGPFEVLNGLTINPGGAFVQGGGGNSVTTRVDGVNDGTFSIDGPATLHSGLLVTTNGTIIGNTSNGVMTVNGGAWQSSSATVGYNGGAQGTLTINGGSNNVTYLGVGINANSSGTVWLNNGSLISTNFDTNLGGNGTGQMTVSNGTWLTKGVSVGAWGTSQGRGTLSIAGGAATLAGQLTIGNQADTIGTVWVTGGQLTVTNGPVTVGLAGAGTLNLAGGTVRAQQLLVTNGASSVVNFNGGTLVSQATTVSNGQNFTIGNTGSGASFLALGGVHNFQKDLYAGYSGAGNQLTITNGATVFSDYGHIGYASGAKSNTVLVTGAGSVWTNSVDFNVGVSGSANTMTIASSGTVFNITGRIGWYSEASSNAVLVTGSGSLWNNSGELHIGENGTANTLTISNGGAVYDSYGILSAQNYNSVCSNNAVVVTGAGSAWTNSSDLVVGRFGPGNTVTITNQGKVVSSSTHIGGAWSPSDACNSNAVVVTGSGSTLITSAQINVGEVGAFNTLTVTNGGAVSSSYGFIGTGSSSRNNAALVTGGGSVWSSSGDLVVGMYGAGSRLTIANSGTVSNTGGHIGGAGWSSGTVDSTNNAVVVSGTGSGWNNSGDLEVGSRGFGNTLTITNGGAVFNGSGTVGNYSSSSNNTVLVTGAGSVWSNSANLNIGYDSAGNQVIVTNSGAVVANNILLGVHAASAQGTLTVGSGTVVSLNLTLGVYGCSATGMVNITGGNLYVTNATHTATLEVRSGTFTLSGGNVAIDRLILTNACGHFVRTGGTLSITATNLDPNLSAVGDGIPNWWKQQYGLDLFNPAVAGADADGDGMSNLQEYLAGTNPTNAASAFRITAMTPTGSNVRVAWKAGSGRTNVVQAASVLGSNSFTDISPPIIISGSRDVFTNYLDIGGATNVPKRFYRIRLWP